MSYLFIKCLILDRCLLVFSYAEFNFYLHLVCFSSRNIASLYLAYSIFSVVGKLDPGDLTTKLLQISKWKYMEVYGWSNLEIVHIELNLR